MIIQIYGEALRRVLTLRGRSRYRAIRRAAETVRAVLDDQNRIALGHRSQSYYTDRQTGRNVGNDELLALAYLQNAQIDPITQDRDREAYLRRIVAEFTLAKERFATAEDDEYGFGVGTIVDVVSTIEKSL